MENILFLKCLNFRIYANDTKYLNQLSKFRVSRQGFHRTQTAGLLSSPGDTQIVQVNHRPQGCAIILPVRKLWVFDNKETFKSWNCKQEKIKTYCGKLRGKWRIWEVRFWWALVFLLPDARKNKISVLYVQLEESQMLRDPRKGLANRRTLLELPYTC